jgi:membrane protease YdiL (CAAX protease family)
MTFIALVVVSSLVIPFLPLPVSAGDAAAALIQTLFIELGLVVMIAWLIHRVYGLSLGQEIRWNTAYAIPNPALVVLGMGLAVAVMVAASMFPANDAPIEELINTPEAVAMFAAYGILVAPAVEEFIFRGFLFRVFETLGGSSVAVRMTALLFGLLHVPQLWGSWAGMLVIFSVGFVLSEIRRRTDSIVPSMIVHFSYNGLILLAGIVGSLVGQNLPADV